jgi:basic amino acid/polyamine antiporter, APA family
VTPEPDGGRSGTLSLPMAFCISLKQVIGGGVIVLTGTAVGMAGAGAALAYGLACVVVLLVSLPYAVLGAARPMSGSLYRWPARVIAPEAGFLAFWMVLSTHVGLAAYATTFADAAHALLPAVPVRATAIGVLLLVLALNLLGTHASARAGILVTALVVASLLLLAAFGAPRVEPDRLLVLAPHGLSALLGAAALLTFSVSGATLVSELSGEMRRPARDVPLAILGATAFAGLLYLGITLVAAGVPAPAGVAADRPLTALAAEVMPPVPRALFELGAGLVSMLGIINAHMLWGSRSILAICQDNWLPRRLSRPNRFGAPTLPLLLLSALGLVPLLLGLDAASVIRVSGLGAALSAILSVCCAPLNARREPDAYRRSPLAVPSGVLLAVSVAAVLSQLATIGLLLRDLSAGLVGGWFAWLALGGLLAMRRRHAVRLSA